nr:EamA family transporter [Pseudomonadota bacterium]
MSVRAAVRAFHPSPYLLLVLTMLFWSGNFVLARAVHAHIPPIALSFWRWALALLFLLPLAWPALRGRGALLRRHWKVLLLLGILGVANYNTLSYIGLQYTTATNAVLMVSVTPVLIVGFSFLLLGHTVTLTQGAGIVLSLLGVAVIVTRGHLDTLLGLELNRGDLWVLAAVLSWALYSVCLRWRPAGLPPMAFMAATIVAGMVLLLPLYLWDIAH